MPSLSSASTTSGPVSTPRRAAAQPGDAGTHHPSRILTGFREQGGEERRGRGLAVGAGDGDRASGRADRSQGRRAVQHWRCPLPAPPRPAGGRRGGRRHDDRVDRRQRAWLADRAPSTPRARSGARNGRVPGRVVTADGVAHLGEQRGDRAHPGATDVGDVDAAPVAAGPARAQPRAWASGEGGDVGGGVRTGPAPGGDAHGGQPGLVGRAGRRPRPRAGLRRGRRRGRARPPRPRPGDGRCRSAGRR